MRELVVQAFLTMDGVMQAPGGPGEDDSGGFAQGGWSFGYWDEAMSQAMGRSFARPFDLVLGRKTYEIFAAHWPRVDNDDPGGKILNHARKYVASTTLRTAGWQNSELLHGDVAAAVQRLKQMDGPELQVHGSSQLLQTLIASRLVDKFRLWVFPVVVGAGKRLFGEGTAPSGFTLAEAKPSSTGVLMCTYRPAGAIRAGTFALDG